MLYWILYVSVVGTIITKGMAQFTTDGCDTTKGCFRDPQDCTGSEDCQFFASWVFDATNNQVRFEISGQATSYIALGLSKSGGMDNSDVYACTKNNEVRRSQNPGYYFNVPKDLKGVSAETIHINAGRIGCEFTRQASIADNDVTYYDLTGSNMYTVIMARSDLDLALNNRDITEHPPDGRTRGVAPVSFATYQQPSATTRIMTSMATPTQRDKPKFTSDGCGSTKGCYRSPPECNGTADCQFFVSWISSNNQVLFSMSATNAKSYVAMGFSKSGQMSDSDVYACTNRMEVVRSRNTVGNINDPTPTLQGVSDESISAVDGRIECQFTRQASLNVDTFYDLSGNNTYYIIMAKSSGDLQNDGNINMHQAREKSAELTSFQQFTETTSEEDKLGNILQKCHGSLMVAAWVFFASLGITLARFYKQIWPNSKTCGKTTWIVLHQFFMILTFMCCTSAFVIIFIAKKGFIEVDYKADLSSLLRFLHAVFGIIVTILVVLNPIMALCRPKPDAPRRYIFNWSHWIVGTSSHFLAMLTICLGVGYRAALPLIAGIPSHVFWVMIVFMAFHFIVWLLLQSHKWMLACQGKTSLTEENGKLVGSSSLTILFFILLLGCFITASYIIITIVLVGLDQPITFN